MRYLRNYIGLQLTLLLLTGCQSKPVAEVPQPAPVAAVPAADPPVQNAFTEYVGQGKTAMDKAHSVSDKMNAHSQETNSQAQTVNDNP